MYGGIFSAHNVVCMAANIRTQGCMYGGIYSVHNTVCTRIYDASVNGVQANTLNLNDTK
jgi:hypothetical protein